MKIQKVKIGGPRQADVVSFVAITTTVGLKQVTAHVAITADALHHQMLKATKNKSKRSSDGALDVTVLEVMEVLDAV